MLIIPLDDKPDWRHPPVLCLLLLAINVAVFIWSSAAEQHVTESIEENVDTSLLAEYEWPLLVAFAREENRRLWYELETAEEQQRPYMMAAGWHDQRFDAFVHAHWQTSPPTEQWRHQREQFESLRDQYPHLRWGLTPAEPRLINFLTALFMHGGILHLVGNMIFLLLFGMPLEKHWGALRLAGLYLASGVGGDILHILFFPDSMTPLIGASGAISGLMGIYVVTYGTHRMEFFYTFGFFFGSFRAPAILMLPFWLGWELFQHFTSNNNVAYMAHAGGIISGAVLASGLRMLTKPQHPRSDPGRTTSASSAGSEVIPETLLRLVEKLDFEQAVSRGLERLKQQPDSTVLWHFCMETAARCAPGAVDRLMKEALKLFHGKKLSGTQIEKIRRCYLEQGASGVQLPASFRILLAEVARDGRDSQHMQDLIRSLHKDGISHPRLAKLELPSS